MTPTIAESVLDFWFGPPPHQPRDEWFRKDATFDAIVRERFGESVDHALAGGFENWNVTARGALARVILLDQFTRNIYRDTPRAFAGDAIALATAEEAIARGFDRELTPIERGFLYLPFEHSEQWPMQERSLALFGPLVAETGDRAMLDWAEKHAAIIRRFGRYPHRNELLGRTSTEAELEFLSQPGSSF